MQDSKMFNSVMWFSTRSRNITVPPVAINKTPLSYLGAQKYLGVTFDTTLNYPPMWQMSARI